MSDDYSCDDYQDYDPEIDYNDPDGEYDYEDETMVQEDYPSDHEYSMAQGDFPSDEDERSIDRDYSVAEEDFPSNDQEPSFQEKAFTSDDDESMIEEQLEADMSAQEVERTREVPTIVISSDRSSQKTTWPSDLSEEDEEKIVLQDVIEDPINLPDYIDDSEPVPTHKDNWVPLYGLRGMVHVVPNSRRSVSVGIRKLLGLPLTPDHSRVDISLMAYGVDPTDPNKTVVMREFEDHLPLRKTSIALQFFREYHARTGPDSNKVCYWFVKLASETPPPTHAPTEDRLKKDVACIGFPLFAGLPARQDSNWINCAYVPYPKHEGDPFDISEWAANQYNATLKTAIEVLLGVPTNGLMHNRMVSIYDATPTVLGGRYGFQRGQTSLIWAGRGASTWQWNVLHPQVSPDSTWMLELVDLDDEAIPLVVPGSYPRTMPTIDVEDAFEMPGITSQLVNGLWGQSERESIDAVEYLPMLGDSGAAACPDRVAIDLVRSYPAEFLHSLEQDVRRFFSTGEKPVLVMRPVWKTSQSRLFPGWRPDPVSDVSLPLAASGIGAFQAAVEKLVLAYAGEEYMPTVDSVFLVPLTPLDRDQTRDLDNANFLVGPDTSDPAWFKMRSAMAHRDYLAYVIRRKQRDWDANMAALNPWGPRPSQPRVLHDPTGRLFRDSLTEAGGSAKKGVAGRRQSKSLGSALAESKVAKVSNWQVPLVKRRDTEWKGERRSSLRHVTGPDGSERESDGQSEEPAEEHSDSVLQLAAQLEKEQRRRSEEIEKELLALAGGETTEDEQSPVQSTEDLFGSSPEQSDDEEETASPTKLVTLKVGKKLLEEEVQREKAQRSQGGSSPSTNPLPDLEFPEPPEAPMALESPSPAPAAFALSKPPTNKEYPEPQASPTPPPKPLNKPPPLGKMFKKQHMARTCFTDEQATHDVPTPKKQTKQARPTPARGQREEMTPPPVPERRREMAPSPEMPPPPRPAQRPIMTMPPIPEQQDQFSTLPQQPTPNFTLALPQVPQRQSTPPPPPSTPPPHPHAPPPSPPLGQSPSIPKPSQSGPPQDTRVIFPTVPGVLSPKIPHGAPAGNPALRATREGSVPVVSHGIMTPTELARLEALTAAQQNMLLERSAPCPYPGCEYTYCMGDAQAIQQHLNANHCAIKCWWCPTTLFEHWSDEQRMQHLRECHAEHAAEVLVGGVDQHRLVRAARRINAAQPRTPGLRRTPPPRTPSPPDHSLHPARRSPPRALKLPLRSFEEQGPVPYIDPCNECPFPECPDPNISALTSEEIFDHFGRHHGGMQTMCPFCQLDFDGPEKKPRLQRHAEQIMHYDCHAYNLWSKLTEWVVHDRSPSGMSAEARRRCRMFKSCRLDIEHLSEEEFQEHLRVEHRVRLGPASFFEASGLSPGGLSTRPHTPSTSAVPATPQPPTTQQSAEEDTIPETPFTGQQVPDLNPTGTFQVPDLSSSQSRSSSGSSPRSPIRQPRGSAVRDTPKRAREASGYSAGTTPQPPQKRQRQRGPEKALGSPEVSTEAAAASPARRLRRLLPKPTPEATATPHGRPLPSGPTPETATTPAASTLPPPRRSPSPDWKARLGPSDPSFDPSGMYCSKCLRRMPKNAAAHKPAELGPAFHQEMAYHTNPNRCCRIRNNLGEVSTDHPLPNRSGWIKERTLHGKVGTIKKHFTAQFPAYKKTVYPTGSSAAPWRVDPNNEGNAEMWNAPWPPYEGDRLPKKSPRRKPATKMPADSAWRPPRGNNGQHSDGESDDDDFPADVDDVPEFLRQQNTDTASKLKRKQIAGTNSQKTILSTQSDSDEAQQPKTKKHEGKTRLILHGTKSLTKHNNAAAKTSARSKKPIKLMLKRKGKGKKSKTSTPAPQVAEDEDDEEDDEEEEEEQPVRTSKRIRARKERKQ